MMLPFVSVYFSFLSPQRSRKMKGLFSSVLYTLQVNSSVGPFVVIYHRTELSDYMFSCRIIERMHAKLDYFFLSFKRPNYFWLKLKNYSEKDSSTSFISRHSRNSITKKLLGVILLAFLINHVFPPFLKRTLHSIFYPKPTQNAL